MQNQLYRDITSLASLLSALFLGKNTVFGTIPRSAVMHYAVKPVQTSCEELQDGQDTRIAESSVRFLDFCRFFLLFDHQEAFHCCLVIACVNK